VQRTAVESPEQTKTNCEGALCTPVDRFEGADFRSRGVSALPGTAKLSGALT
jgi:hypothetical protein